MYLGRLGSSNFTVIDNLIYLNEVITPGNGIMLRPGGTISGNVIAGTGMTGMTFGSLNDGSGGATGSNGPVVADGNLVIDSAANALGGVAYGAPYVLPNAQITNNICLRAGGINTSGNDGTTVTGNITVGSVPDTNFVLGSGNDQVWSNNIFSNAPAHSHVIAWLTDTPNGVAGTCANFTARGNRFDLWSEGNTNMSFATWVAKTGETGTNGPIAFIDATRSLGTYNGTLGGTATTQAFFEAALNQSKNSYDPRYTAAAANAYIRAGLAIASP
jgi:hypothetical protein